MRLIQHGSAFEIETAGKERATMTGASPDSDRPVDTLERNRNGCSQAFSHKHPSGVGAPECRTLSEGIFER
jgi:hypothetical protein